MKSSNNGILIIIGGAEDKTGEMTILKRFVSMISESNSKLMILTTATQEPELVGDEYRGVFKSLGVNNIDVLNINTRDDANNDDYVNRLKQSKGIFFTGGDQLRITSIIGGTKSYQALSEGYINGSIISGTSAGASAMSNIMIIEGDDNKPARKCTLKVAQGLNFLSNVIIDQHFAQRGRIGRLLCGVAENPDVLGIGIDEDTAIIVYPDSHFEVIGTNSVTVIDGKTIKSSNVSELQPDEILSITNVTLHILPKGYGFDLINNKVLRKN